MDVGLALRNCPKGQLKYDKYWIEEGRTKEVLDDISKFSSRISVRISPKLLPVILNEQQQPSEKDGGKGDSFSSPSAKTNEKPTTLPSASDVYFYQLQSEMQLPLQEYEEERLKYIQDAFENKRNEFDIHTLEVQEQINQEYLLARRKNEFEAKRRDNELKKLEESMMKEAQEVEKLQKEKIQSHVKKLSAKIYEAELKQKQAEEELRKRLQEQNELKSQLLTCQQEANRIVSKSIEKLNLCDYQNHLSVSKEARIKELKGALEVINRLVADSNGRDLTIDDILNANLHVQKACEILVEITSDIDSAKVKASREQAINSIASTLPKVDSVDSSIKDTLNSMSTTAQEQKVENSNKASSNNAKKQLEAEQKAISLYIAPDALKDYESIMKNFKRVDAIVQSVRNDPKNKRYRFELQKAVNVPINSLSSNSGSQIKTKISRLVSILTGKAPETSGKNLGPDSPIFNFCTYLIAKQFVEQGDTQISSQHSTAFPIAFAALGVWMKQPEVGQLLLGHLYSKCPYLVPYYPPKEEDQSNEDYLKSIGYRENDDGTIEAKYKYLNRISGYVRLYAAIIQSPLPANTTTPHPHGIEHGWRWLSRTLNLDPRPDITPTVLYDFLDVAGYALQKAYGKQFNKLLHILCKDYFQRIKQVTPGGTGGPLERLEIFLQHSAKTGRISPPEGALDASFWVR